MVWSTVDCNLFRTLVLLTTCICFHVANCGNASGPGHERSADSNSPSQLSDQIVILVKYDQPPSSSGQVFTSQVSENLSISSVSDTLKAPALLEPVSPLPPSSSISEQPSELPSTEPTDSPKSSEPSSPPEFPSGVSNELSQDVVKIVASNNQLGFKIFKTLAKSSGSNNLFTSPLSLFSTLISLYAGSAGSTQDEMVDLLELQNMTEAQIQTAYRDVLHTLTQDVGENNTFTLLNAILIERDINVSSSYVDKVRTYYNAYLEKVNFRTEPAYVTQWTNELVSWATKGLIPNLIDETLDHLTRLLLLNVIYFKGTWSKPFDPLFTGLQTNFRNFDQTQSKVPMMRSTEKINYHCDNFFARACLVEKIYSGGSLSFLVITPTNGTDLTHLETSLGSQSMYKLIGRLRETSVELGLPRFNISGSYDLDQSLRDLGIMGAFSNANLSKISNSKGLSVDKVMQKTVLQVTEEGTIAAGATYVKILVRARPRLPRIIIDRPFLFMIRDLRTDAILFLGRVNSLP